MESGATWPIGEYRRKPKAPPVRRRDLGHAAAIQRVVGGASHVDVVERWRHQSHGHEAYEVARFPEDAISKPGSLS